MIDLISLRKMGEEIALEPPEKMILAAILMRLSFSDNISSSLFLEHLPYHIERDLAKSLVDEWYGQILSEI